ncbi:hypothetical protein [Thermofilum pendens]|uniref:Uncharacterized protein n=1 Tax=Thermofilum pendens (strain DSM 2475 / Hrk 5) TaxID=368408 RepID=A1RZ09_THEPD|nr:hypothetical protein [Thermofilum pendens]ABL78439.1 hypothetical protein Tpen_1039 [Thermofilum pendens Hrk 5]
MKASRLLAALAALLAVVLVVAVLQTGESPEKVIVDARNRLLGSKGWVFEERVNFTKGWVRVLVSGTVDLGSHTLNTTVVVLRGSQPSLSVIYSNRSVTLVNLGGGWARAGEGWRVNDTVIYRLLELARASPEKHLKPSAKGFTVFFGGGCTDTCTGLYQYLLRLAGLEGSNPTSYKGVLTVEEGYPRAVYVEFYEGGEATCSLLYSLRPLNV